MTLFSVLCQQPRGAAVPDHVALAQRLRHGQPEVRRGCAYHTRIVCDPASSEDSEVEFPVAGSDGRPNEAVSTTVPVSGGGWSRPPRRAAEPRCARAARARPGADVISDPARTPPVMTSALSGIAHRGPPGQLAGT